MCCTNSNYLNCSHDGDLECQPADKVVPEDKSVATIAKLETNVCSTGSLASGYIAASLLILNVLGKVLADIK